MWHGRKTMDMNFTGFLYPLADLCYLFDNQRNWAFIQWCQKAPPSAQCGRQL